MKKQLLMAALLIAGSGLLPAQETTFPGESDPNAVDEQLATPCPMCMMMAGHLFKSELIATADGGALLMIGGTLYKYDAELNLIAETQLQLDPQRIQTQLQTMMSDCPACQQKMQMMQQYRGRRFNGYAVPEGGVTEGDGVSETNGQTEENGKTDTNGTTEPNGQTNGAAEGESLQEYGQPDDPKQKTPDEKKLDKPEARQPEETRL